MGDKLTELFSGCVFVCKSQVAKLTKTLEADLNDKLLLSCREKVAQQKGDRDVVSFSSFFRFFHSIFFCCCFHFSSCSFLRCILLYWFLLWLLLLKQNFFFVLFNYFYLFFLLLLFSKSFYVPCFLLTFFCRIQKKRGEDEESRSLLNDFPISIV